MGRRKEDFFLGSNRRLTALLDFCACLGKLDEDDVAEALLSIIRNGHRSDATLVVKRDYLVISRVSFRWSPGIRRFVLVVFVGAKDSLIMVRLRASEAGRKAC